MSNSTKLKEVNALLAKWDLLELQQHFEDEGICIEELLLMNVHHLPVLLKDFKFGTLIRFEHHFTKWRRDLNKPLKEPAGYANAKSSKAPDDERSSQKESDICEGELSDNFCLTFHNSEQNAGSYKIPSAPEDTPDVLPVITIWDIIRTTDTNIIEYYAKHKILTRTQCALLVKLIHNYCDSYRVALCHEFELQVFKMFPRANIPFLLELRAFKRNCHCTYTN